MRFSLGMHCTRALVVPLAFASQALVAAPATSATLYAGDFLAIGISPRATGMGAAVTATTSGPEAAYWNPAGLAASFSGARAMAAFEHAERFSGIVKHDVISAALPISNGVLGAFLFRGAIDGIIYADSTTLVDPSLPLSASNMPDPAKTWTFSNADYVLQLSFGRALGENWRVGTGIKLIRRTIGRTGAFGYGIDLGGQWNATPQLAFGLLVRDATTTRVSWDNNRTDIVYPTVHTGLAYTIPIPRIKSTLVMAGNTTLGSPGGGYGGFAPWRLLEAQNVANLGAEFEWRETIAIRLGSQNVRGMLGPGSAEISAGMSVWGALPWFSGIRRAGVDLAWMRHTLRDSFRLGTRIEW